MVLPFLRTAGRPAVSAQMYSPLVDNLPETVDVDGEKCFLKTDFKNWIKFEIIVTDGKLTEEQKFLAVLPVCFKKLPSCPEVAVKACIKFYGSGEVSRKNETEKKRPLYSFVHDGELIYSAFMSQYGIDLAGSTMHWYKFRALFKGLKADTKFAEAIYIRGLDLSEIKDAEVRKKYRELKKIWRLPDLRSEEEKRKDIVSAVEKAF